MKPMLLTLICAAALAASACASETPQQADRGPQGANDSTLVNGRTPNGANSQAVPPGTQIPGNSATAAGCGYPSAAGGLALFNEGRMQLKADTITVFKNRQRQSVTLCQVLQGTGKKVAIFQFAGATCSSCRVDSATIRNNIRASRYAQEIAHVVVLTDMFDDTTDAEFSAFMTQYAPGDLAVYDESVLWKELSADSAYPDRATILALGLDMNAVVLNHSGSVNEIVADAETLVGSQMVGARP